MRYVTHTALFLSLAIAFAACTGNKEPETAAAPPPAASVPADTASNLTLSGKVSYQGAVVKADAVKMNADPYCAKHHAGKGVTSESVIVNANGTLSNVFVYIKEGVKSSPPADLTPVTLDQTGCRYAPHVFGVRVNQPIRILNSDSTLHNVNAMAKVNSGFNVGMPTKGQASEKKFTKPETMIRFKCDVHGWMGAYVGVVDHPYFAVTDDSGAFSLKGLPAGAYVVEAWHEKYGVKTLNVNLTVESAAKPIEMSF